MTQALPAEPDDGLPLDLRPDPRLEPAAGAPARRPRFRRRWLLVLLVPPLMFSGAVIGLYYQPPGLQKFYALTGLQPGGGAAHPIALPPEIAVPRALAETLLPTDVVGLARLMPRGDVAVVAAPYGAGDARVAEVLVAEGETVVRGQTVALLDNRQALEAAALTAGAALAVAEAGLAQSRSAVSASRLEAGAALDQARAAAREAETERARAESLAARGVATAAVLDAARTAAEDAALAVTRAEATFARYGAGPLDAQPDVAVAARNVAAAQAELARARMDLARSEVRAPVSGVILDIHATPGQRPPSEGIMEMGDTAAMMAEVEVWQDRIAAVAVGQPVELAAGALDRPLRGRVERIGLTVGRQGLISDDAAANADARVVRVLVALDAASTALAARLVGLEAVARIDTGAAERAASPARP